MSSGVSHMDVFLALTLLRNQYPFMDDETIVCQISMFEHAPWRGEGYANRIRRYPPSTKHLVNALYDKGYKPGFIAEYLNINATTVSYHLKHKPEKPYSNPVVCEMYDRLYCHFTGIDY